MLNQPQMTQHQAQEILAKTKELERTVSEFVAYVQPTTSADVILATRAANERLSKAEAITVLDDIMSELRAKQRELAYDLFVEQEAERTQAIAFKLANITHISEAHFPKLTVVGRFGDPIIEKRIKERNKQDAPASILEPRMIKGRF